MVFVGTATGMTAGVAATMRRRERRHARRRCHRTRRFGRALLTRRGGMWGFTRRLDTRLDRVGGRGMKHRAVAFMHRHR